MPQAELKDHTLSLVVEPQVGRAFAPMLRRLIPQAIALLKSPLSDFTIVLINDARMAELHGQFMAQPTTTDVMTFPLDFDRRGRALGGEVYVCIPEARRQAKARGTKVDREVLLYAVHGVLHLCGYDDRTDRDYRLMHRREDQILTQLGVGPVFAPPASARPQKRRRA